MTKNYIYPITVQFEDVDSYSIVHHTKLVAYLERARVSFFREQGTGNILEQNFEILLYALTMTFKKPARFLDELTVSISEKKRETFCLTLAYHIRRNTELIAKAETELAFVDKQSKELIPVPDFKI